MPRRIEEIQRDLNKIHELEVEIETRLASTSKPVRDIKDKELTASYIEGRIKEMAAEFCNACAIKRIKNPVLVTVREGATTFANLFMKELTALGFLYTPASVSTTRYDGTKGGKLKVQHDGKVEFGCTDVVFLEDIIDEGNTYLGLLNEFEKFGPSSMQLVAMLDKIQDKPRDKNADLVGITLSKHPSGEDKFVVGYGLDYRGLLRTLTDVREVDRTQLPNAAEIAILDRKKPLNRELQERIALDRSAPTAEQLAFAERHARLLEQWELEKPTSKPFIIPPPAASSNNGGAAPTDATTLAGLHQHSHFANAAPPTPAAPDTSANAAPSTLGGTNV